MFVFKAGLSFILILCVVKSEDVDNEPECNDYYKDMNNKPIINVTHYCNNNSCIIKCCGDGEILNHRWICQNTTKFKTFISRINSSNLTLFSWDASGPKESQKNLTQDFVFIQNQKFSMFGCSFRPSNKRFYIIENGSIKLESDSSETSWIDIQRLDYCVDFKLYQQRNKSRLLFVFKKSVTWNSEDDNLKSKFIPIGLLTSCFFLLLVLVVYGLLPQLQNIMGMILMGYVSSLFVAFLLRVILDLITESITAETCKILSPFSYYASLSSFCWLTIMSFDIWWMFRGTRKCREIHRQGDLVKFMWYSLYAWGAPLVLTILAVIVDNMDLPESTSILKPPFSSCLSDDQPVLYYLQVPIAIICSVNIILFVMTAYNIWMIKRGFHNCEESRKSKEEKNRFIIYMKLAVIMGVGWCLELIPDSSAWTFIVINSYNIFLGVTIFFLFVFKKSVLIKLCKRFGIKHDFIQNHREVRHSRSGTTRYTRTSVLKSPHVSGSGDHILRN